jgi:hypothetical protein
MLAERHEQSADRDEHEGGRERHARGRPGREGEGQHGEAEVEGEQEGLPLLEDGLTVATL